MSKIYVIHHATENYPAFTSDIVTPILAGLSGTMGQRIQLRDDTGDCKKSERERDLYSEFTALYWIWKNRRQAPTDKIGLMHYRSFLDISDNEERKNYYSFETRFGYTKDTIDRAMRDKERVNINGEGIKTKGVDVITSPPMFFSESLYEQFNCCHPFASKLFDASRDLLKENSKYSDMAGFFDEHFNKRNVYGFYKCLSVSTWEYFDQYCSFMFYMLDGLYGRLGDKIVKELKMIRGPDKPETQHENAFRLLAFMGERLTSFFIAYSIKTNKFGVGVADRCHYESMSDYMSSVYPIVKDRYGRNLKIMLRAYSISLQDHMAITDMGELDRIKSKGYFLDGPLGYIYSEKHPSVAVSPVYRYVSGDQHAYTRDPSSLSGYTKDKVLGYSMDSPGTERLHLNEYCGVGLPYGNVPSIDPGEFTHVGYDPDNPYMDLMADLGYLHSGDFRDEA